jgi:hypothetical protein
MLVQYMANISLEEDVKNAVAFPRPSAMSYVRFNGIQSNARSSLLIRGKENCLQSQWNFGIIGLVASRSVSVRCKWEVPDYKEDKSHNSAAKLWHVRNASLKKLSI